MAPEQDKRIPIMAGAETGVDYFPKPSDDPRVEAVQDIFDMWITRVSGLRNMLLLTEREVWLKETLQGMDAQEAATFIDEVGTNMAYQIGREVSLFHTSREELFAGIRPTDASALESHLYQVEQTNPEIGIGEGGRHGDQMLNEITAAIKDPAARKRMQMKNPHNESDPTTVASMIEAVKEGLALLWISEKTGRKVEIISSQNARAAQVAEIQAHVLGAEVTYDTELNCDNYPPESQMSDEKLKEELEKAGAPDGSIPWIPTIINKIFGKRRFQTLTITMSRKIKEALNKKNTITRFVTHSQALSAMGAKGRLGLLGFVGTGYQFSDSHFKGK